MQGQQPIIDSHVHLDLIVRHHPHRIQWLTENNCHVVSWAYFERVASGAHLQECLAAKARCLRTHAASGLECHYLIGVHPRSIPPDLKPEQIPALLEPFLGDSLCKGIGEIGLETGTIQEQEILIAQLEFGRRHIGSGTVIGVHTPRTDKLRMTQTTLGLLDGLTDMAPSLVVDHCTGETIGAVLDAGFWAGVTLSPVKTSWDEMKRIAATFADRIDRIMINTDSGSDFYEDAVRYRHSGDIAAVDRERLSFLNASTFFAFPSS